MYSVDSGERELRRFYDEPQKYNYVINLSEKNSKTLKTFKRVKNKKIVELKKRLALICSTFYLMFNAAGAV